MNLWTLPDLPRPMYMFLCFFCRCTASCLCRSCQDTTMKWKTLSHIHASLCQCQNQNQNQNQSLNQNQNWRLSLDWRHLIERSAQSTLDSPIRRMMSTASLKYRIGHFDWLLKSRLDGMIYQGVGLPQPCWGRGGGWSVGATWANKHDTVSTSLLMQLWLTG